VLKHEKSKDISFLWLQSKKAKEYLQRFQIPQGIDSIILIKDCNAYVKSDAGLKLGQYLKWPYAWSQAFLIVPRPIRDWIYDFVARHRKKIMGSTTCALPIGHEDRFL
jgi:predicted DCC family thiol-disulfide oxidoreductase YuxK